MENHITSPSYLSQPLPPIPSGRYSPTPKAMMGEDDITRYTHNHTDTHNHIHHSCGSSLDSG